MMFVAMNLYGNFYLSIWIYCSTDKMSETAILEVVRKNFGDHLILGEEGGLIGDNSSDYLWCIDPLGLALWTLDYLLLLIYFVLNLLFLFLMGWRVMKMLSMKSWALVVQQVIFCFSDIVNMKIVQAYCDSVLYSYSGVDKCILSNWEDLLFLKFLGIGVGVLLKEKVF